MWSDLLGLALLVSLNPMLVGSVLLVVSRPRPLGQLLAYWIGALIVNVPAFLGTLAILHMIPDFGALAQGMTTPSPGSSVKPFQLVTGIITVIAAGLMVVHRWSRQRSRAAASVGTTGGADAGDAPVQTLEDDAPATGLVARIRALFGRLLARGKNAWDNGALWVALVLGLAYLPPPPLLFLICTMVIGSGEPVGTQVLAVVVFVLTMLAALELILVSYLIAPDRTQAVLRPVHDWALRNRQMVLIVLFAVVGFFLLMTGAGLS